MPAGPGTVPDPLPMRIPLALILLAMPLAAQAPRRVLFVGNSLTYTNDLPGTVSAIAASVGDDVTVASAAGPNLALIDHLSGATDAARRITSGRWDYVILQQGPTTIAMCRDSLVLWTRMFDSLARRAGARTALLMPWPRADEPELSPAVHGSFALAARAVDGIFIPAGDAWRRALDADPAAGVYGPDGYHPSPRGTWLAALVTYERLSGRDARTIVPPASLGLSPVEARRLGAAAHEAVRAAARPPSPGEPPAPGRTIPGLDHC